MRQSETINKLLEALTKAQAEFVTLPKDKSGYGYKYTDLDTVISTVRPIMARHSLGFMQSLTTLDGGHSGITTRIFSSTGEYIEDTIALPEISVGKTNAAQNMGAAITYMKRYALCAILGISSDEDTDAATPKQQPGWEKQMSPAAQVERNKAKRQAPAPQQRPQQPQLAGGPDTPEEHKTINQLLSATSPFDGVKLFGEDTVQMVQAMRTQKTAGEVITWLKTRMDEAITGHQQFTEETGEQQEMVIF